MINRKNIIIIAIMAIMLMGSVVLSAESHVWGRVYNQNGGCGAHLRIYVETTGNGWLWLEDGYTNNNGDYRIGVDQIPNDHNVKIICTPYVDNIPREKIVLSVGGGAHADFLYCSTCKLLMNY